VAVSTMLDAHRRGMRDHSERLFALVVLDEWLSDAASRAREARRRA
jgi:hypothetical protein